MTTIKKINAKTNLVCPNLNYQSKKILMQMPTAPSSSSACQGKILEGPEFRNNLKLRVVLLIRMKPVL